MKVTNDIIKANGTILLGYITSPYEVLCEKLGDPNRRPSEDGKVTCEWIIDFEDGSIGTIYTWKTGENLAIQYEWSVGGRGTNILEKISKLIGRPARRTLMA